MRSAPPLAKVQYDQKLHIVRNALGTHTTVSRAQGNRLKAKREIRVASLFKQAPVPFPKMIVVHELAHLRELDHDKAFYALCTHLRSPRITSSSSRCACASRRSSSRRAASERCATRPLPVPAPWGSAQSCASGSWTALCLPLIHPPQHP